MVKGLAKSQADANNEYDDLFQEGCLALIKAASDYKKSKGDFLEYATVCISKAIEEYKKTKSDNWHGVCALGSEQSEGEELTFISLNEELEDGEEFGESVPEAFDYLGDLEAISWTEDVFNYLQRRMSPRQYKALKCYVDGVLNAGRTKVDVAKEIGETTQYIFRVQNMSMGLLYSAIKRGRF